MNERQSVLIVDDDPGVCKLLSTLMERSGFNVQACDSYEAAVEFLSTAVDKIDLVFLDFNLPSINGIEAIPKLKSFDPNLPIIMITGEGGTDLAVRAVTLGAVDFIEKPFDNDVVKRAATRLLELRKVSRQIDTQSNQGYTDDLGIITNHPSMRQIFESVEDVSDTLATVLILGESGTGKELIAKMIHKRSKRSNKPFVAVNCAAIPESLMESELFGAEKGAYTGADSKRIGKFEQANGGSLFLDEIGDMPLHLQAKVLRALQEKTVTPLGSNQERPVDVRIIAATHQNLRSCVEEKQFREDLYYRLAQFPIEVPPLRERGNDVRIIGEYLLAQLAKVDVEVSDIQPGVWDVLKAYDWPGNVRELENVLLQTAIRARGTTMSVGHLPRELLARVNVDVHVDDQIDVDLSSEEALIPLWSTAGDIWPLEQVEKVTIQHALSLCEGNVSQAAKTLEIGRATLYRKIEQFGLDQD